MYVIIDNYDSFTHNLYQYLRELTEAPVEVFRNDKITVDEIAAMKPAGIVISPGPGRPEEAGISMELIKRLRENGFEGEAMLITAHPDEVRIEDMGRFAISHFFVKPLDLNDLNLSIDRVLQPRNPLEPAA